MKKNIIYDGENYYLFRSLNDGNMADLEKRRRKNKNR